MTARSQLDIHAEITNKLIAAIEANPAEPQLPWRKSTHPLWLPVNALTAKRYNGVNIISLWLTSINAGYATPFWATYRQWAELGAQVKRGAKASIIVFYKQYDADPNPDDPGDDGKRRVARASWVFNCDQVEGYVPPSPPQFQPLGPVERIERADRFLAATGAHVVHGGEQAFYRPSTDTIYMPDEERFTGTATMTRSEGYFATLAHETIHWTSAAHRLNRQLAKRFGDDQYAAEELVAEIGCAYMCAELGITQSLRPDHAQYLAHWLKLLKNDDRAIFTAAARASEAVTYLHGLQPPGSAPDAIPVAPLAAAIATSAVTTTAGAAP
jgi:antirestriction protein ArdC